VISWMGGLLVIGASSAIGLLLTCPYTERCRLLKLWEWVVEILKTEIQFQSHRMPEVFRRVGQLMDEPELGGIFFGLGSALEYGSDHDLETAWAEFLAQAAWRDLKSDDREILRQLGAFLGATDRKDQLAKLASCQTRLERQLQSAETARRKQVGVCRYLGFAAGVILVLWVG
jgi:stage III sporulation protein AB